MSSASDAARIILRAKLAPIPLAGNVTADALVIELNNAGVFAPDLPTVNLMPAWPITTDTGGRA